MSLPALDDYRPTRDALHAWSRLLGGIRRQLVPAHPRWWHVSLAVTGSGFSTGPIVLADAELEIDLDIVEHRLAARLDGRAELALELGDGGSATEMGKQLLEGLGSKLPDELSSEAWADDEATEYRPAAAAELHRAFREAGNQFDTFRRRLPADEVSPLQLWPHHFDLSFEWLGGRSVRYQEDGRWTESPAQIGFGFSTGDQGHRRPYFYANPWPFDEDALLDRELPAGARWHTEGWRGALLPYDEVLRAGIERPLDFIEAVDRAARPSLSAES